MGESSMKAVCKSLGLIALFTLLLAMGCATDDGGGGQLKPPDDPNNGGGGTIDAPPDAANLPPGAGKELFQDRCAYCHDLAIALQMKKTRESWRLTVESMHLKPFSGITEDEVQAIADYLAQIRPE